MAGPSWLKIENNLIHKELNIKWQWLIFRCHLIFGGPDFVSGRWDELFYILVIIYTIAQSSLCCVTPWPSTMHGEVMWYLTERRHKRNAQECNQKHDFEFCFLMIDITGANQHRFVSYRDYQMLHSITIRGDIKASRSLTTDVSRPTRKAPRNTYFHES